MFILVRKVTTLARPTATRFHGAEAKDDLDGVVAARLMSHVQQAREAREASEYGREHAPLDTRRRPCWNKLQSFHPKHQDVR
jgi:hypothetical protein